jgi:uncharacterized protein YjbI with pentapeptide repeats
MASPHPQGQHIDARGFEQHQEQTSQLNLPDLDEDLDNFDDLDWSFLGDATNPNSDLAHTLNDSNNDSNLEKQDDPFSQISSGAEISEAEFFDLVADQTPDRQEDKESDRFDFLDAPEYKQDLEIPEVDAWESDNADYTSFLSVGDAFDLGDEINLPEPLPEHYSEFSSFDELNQDLEYLQDLEQGLNQEFDWQADDADDLTSILSPKELLAKLRSEDIESSAEIAIGSTLEEPPENVSQLKNYFEPDLSEAPNESVLDDWQDDFGYNSFMGKELELSNSELSNKYEPEQNSLGLPEYEELESSMAEFADLAAEPPLIVSATLPLEDFVEDSLNRWNVAQFPPLQDSENSLEVESEIQSEVKLDTNPLSTMPDYKPSDPKVVDSSALDFEDPEDLEEEILFSNTAFKLPDLTAGNSSQNQFLDSSLIEDFSSVHTISDLPELKSFGSNLASNLAKDITDGKLNESFTSHGATLIPLPQTLDEQKNTSSGSPNYLADFSQEFVKSETNSNADLPALPVPPLPRLPQIPQLSQRTEGYTQPLAQIQTNQPPKSSKSENVTSALTNPREPKKAETKFEQDDDEQDWLDSFDEIANDMEWEELADSQSGKASQEKDDTPTSFITPIKSPTPKASPNISPSLLVSSSSQKPPLPPKAESSAANKSADVFNLDDDSMEWTAVLDSDTEFVKEIASIQEQKKSSNPKENSKELLISEPNDRFSDRDADNSFDRSFKTPSKPAIDLSKFPKPLAIAGGAIAAVALFVTFLGAGIGRFTLENGLKLGLFKDAKGKELKGANLERGNLRQANLSDANLEGANLRGTILVEADLRGANIKGANLRGAKLNGTKFELANKKNLTKLDERSLLMWQMVNQSKAGRYLSGANLDGFNLDSANLRNANLSRAKLTWVNFENANLSGANLAGADISGTNFVKANLKGAVFGGTKWDKDREPKTDVSTTCPNGKKGPCPLR